MCVCRLNFDNSAYRYIMKEDEEEQEILPITSDFFFEVFPFNIVFRQVTSRATQLSNGSKNSWLIWNVCPSSLHFFILGHGGAQCRLRSGHSLPRSGWQEDQRCLLVGPPPCGVHLEHGKASVTHTHNSAVTQRPFSDLVFDCVHRSSLTPTTCLRSCPRSLWRGRGTFITESRVRVEAGMQTLAGVCSRRSRTCWLDATNGFDAVSCTRHLRLVCWAMDVWTWLEKKREV